MLAYNAVNETASYPFSVIEQDSTGIIKIRDLFSAIIHDLSNDISQATIAARFHNTIARMILELCQVTSDKTGVMAVMLSGGVFQNRLLLRKAVNLLEENGFKVYTHRQVPCNDGGISLGQVIIANFTT